MFNQCSICAMSFSLKFKGLDLRIVVLYSTFCLFYGLTKSSYRFCSVDCESSIDLISQEVEDAVERLYNDCANGSLRNRFASGEEFIKEGLHSWDVHIDVGKLFV